MYYYDAGGFGWFIGLVFISTIIFHAIRDSLKVKHSEWDERVEQEKLRILAEEEKKHLILSKILITEEHFNALSEVSAKLSKLINRLCYDKDFRCYCHNKDEHTRFLTNGKDMYIDFKYKPLNDILWIYDQQGHLYQEIDPNDGKAFGYINFETAEGHCLYIIYESMFHIDCEYSFTYEEYQKAVGDPESSQYKYREDIAKGTFKIHADYNPATEQKDYEICNLVHDYNQDYEQLYRILMYDIAKLVAEADGTTSLKESQWLTNNLPTRTSATDTLELIISHYKAPLFMVSNQSNWYEDDDEDYNDLSATVTYSILDAPEEECDLDNLSSRDLQRLKAADDDGEYLDSEYISEHMHSIHNKIIEAIRDDLESKTGDPHDGMREFYYPPAYHTWEKVHTSHQDMLFSDDYEIEYTVDIY